MTLEADIENGFVAYAESLGCKALKLRIDGQNGWPDRTVLTPYGVLFFEFKQLKGRTRAMQRVWHKILRSFGFKVFLPRRKGEAEEVLREWLDGHKGVQAVSDR